MSEPKGKGNDAIINLDLPDVHVCSSTLGDMKTNGKFYQFQF